MKYGKADVS